LKIQNGLFLERENIGNLLQERNLIRSTRQEYTANVDPRHLKLRLYYMQEFYLKVSSYDSNIITGGLEPIFWDRGFCKIQTGSSDYILTYGFYGKWKILKSVYISKTILSQAIDQSLLNM
jgi:curli production assembly/transport component CsgG